MTTSARGFVSNKGRAVRVNGIFCPAMEFTLLFVEDSPESTERTSKEWSLRSELVETTVVEKPGDESFV